MSLLRRYLAVLLTVALTGYVTAATARAHEHASSGFHTVHVVSGDHHDDGGHHHGDPDSREIAQLDESVDPDTPASDHHDSDFHCHGAPQFGPTDATNVFALALALQRAFFFDPNRLASKAQDESPFKPPRILL